MNEETYEALKRIIATSQWGGYQNKSIILTAEESDVRQVEIWIDEVAKEYREE